MLKIIVDPKSLAQCFTFYNNPMNTKGQRMCI